MIARLFGPFGDVYRHDTRSPYVAEDCVDINPADARELARRGPRAARPRPPARGDRVAGDRRAREATEGAFLAMLPARLRPGRRGRVATRLRGIFRKRRELPKELARAGAEAVGQTGRRVLRSAPCGWAKRSP